MFCVYEPFPDGWNRVRITNIKPKLVGSENVLATFVRNQDGAEKMFYIFLNNTTLVKALILKTLGAEGLNRDIEEEELKDKEIMIFLQPKASYQIITTIMGCEEDDEEYNNVPIDLL